MTAPRRDDASSVFSLLGEAPLPEGLTDAVSRGVSEAIDRDSRATPSRLAWAAALLLAVGVAWLAADAPAPPVPGGPGPAPRASVTLQAPSGQARLVDLTVGATQVVMIFDEEMDL